MKWLFAILLISIHPAHAEEGEAGDNVGAISKKTLSNCEGYRKNEEDVRQYMTTGVDESCRKAIEDGRKACFGSEKLSDEDKETLQADGGGAAGANQSAAIESSRNRMLAKKMKGNYSRCDEGAKKVKEVCGKVRDEYRAAMKGDKEATFNSDLPKRMTALQYASEAGYRSLSQAADCNRAQASIYETAANQDDKVRGKSGQDGENAHGEAKGHDDGHGASEHAAGDAHHGDGGHGDDHGEGHHALQADDKLKADMVHHGTVEGTKTVAETLHHAPKLAGVAGRTAAKVIPGAGVAYAAYENDHINTAIGIGAIAAESAGFASMGPALGLSFMLSPGTTNSRCDGVYNPVDAVRTSCPYTSQFGAQSIDAASKVLEHP